MQSTRSASKPRLPEVSFEGGFSVAGRDIVRIVSAQPPVSPVEVLQAHFLATIRFAFRGSARVPEVRPAECRGHRLFRR